MHPLVAAADLVVGAACPGCGTPALRLCRLCGEAVPPDPSTVDPPRQVGVPVVAAGPYSGILRRTVLAWKEQGREPLTAVLACHLAAAVVPLLDDRPAVLVPAPSSAGRWSRRGEDRMGPLVAAAAERIAALDVPVSVRRLLVRTRRVADQTVLGAGGRAANQHASMHAGAVVPERGALVVVVDDVVTTGSTLAEAVRALRVRGHGVAGAAVVAATPAPTARRRSDL